MKIPKTLYFFLACCSLLCFILISGCDDKQSEDVPDKKIAEKCYFDNSFTCENISIEGKTLRLTIMSIKEDDIELNEIKIYNAGTCGAELFNGERFPQIFKGKTGGVIQTVCNLIPDDGFLDSPIILRYINKKDDVLNTVHGNITVRIRI
jgi:hypothetical protein